MASGETLRHTQAGEGPFGLLATGARLDALRAEVVGLPSWDLTPRQVLDLELLINGGFAPLPGFATAEDYESILREMQLADGTLWPIPVTLDVSEAFYAKLREGDRVALRHPEGMVLAVMTVQSSWNPDRREEARWVFGTENDRHPGVFHLLHETNPVYLGGPVEGVETVPHHTYRDLRHTPAELRAEFRRRGWDRVVGFQTRNPMHRAHVELSRRAAEHADAHLLLHPVVGRTSPGDLDYFVRVRCYQAVMPRYPEGLAALSLLPLAMRMAGPREALWHALIRRNYGCTHFVVGRDHAGPSDNGAPFYGPHEAQALVREHERDLGIEMVPFDEFVYVPSTDAYMARKEVPPGAATMALSGTDLRQRLRRGADLPTWFTYPEVARELRRLHPPRLEQGCTVFFTGLSGAGKSTIANVLVAKLMEDGSRPVTLLDGDLVRKTLSSELGFSREHRDLNVRRIGFVAEEITKNGGVAVCAPIAPYDATRKAVRREIGRVGGFVLVHVATPLPVCEARDRKGLYARARAGLVHGVTGIDDPYEAPTDAEVVVDGSALLPDEAANHVIEHLSAAGYLVPQSPKS